MRPVFSEQYQEETLSRPISKLAIVSLILGLLGLLSLLTGWFLPASLAAICFGVVASLLIARNQNELSGKWPAQLGIFLGTTAAIWSTMVSKQSHDRMAELSGQYASYYLELLAKGEIYKAAELELPVGARLLPGMDLKQYYHAYTGAVTNDALQANESGPDPKAIAKRRLQDLIKNPVTKYVQQKPNATWKLMGIANNRYLEANIRRISVLMADSQAPEEKIEVVLERQEFDDKGQWTADWTVKATRLLF